MKTNTIKVGIMPLEKYKKRTISIAKGEYKPKSLKELELIVKATHFQVEFGFDIVA